MLPLGLLIILLAGNKEHLKSLKFDYATNTATESNKFSSQKSNEKQKGVHLFGRSDSIDFQFLKDDNIEWVTFVSWAHQDDFDSADLNHFNGDSVRMLKMEARWVHKIKIAHAAGLKVFFKPHVWLTDPSHGNWRSDVFFTDADDWEMWKENYTRFILHYAKLAEATHTEMFCVGTELSRLTVEKPLYWRELIKQVRQVYSGELTYAANWYNEYEKISFWDDLDYIGIQAYFPLSKKMEPSTKKLCKGWRKYLPHLESMHKKYNRKILFTEMGYKSTPDSAIEPWTWLDGKSADELTCSYETQSNCYEAFFKTIWKMDWFAGVHIWQMRNGDPGRSPKLEFDFTPLGKPAEKIIAKGFN